MAIRKPPIAAVAIQIGQLHHVTGVMRVKKELRTSGQADEERGEQRAGDGGDPLPDGQRQKISHLAPFSPTKPG